MDINFMKASMCKGFCNEDKCRYCWNCPVTDLNVDNCGGITFRQMLKGLSDKKKRKQEDSVIRCRSCRYYMDRKVCCGHEHGLLDCNADSFCSYAERK